MIQVRMLGGFCISRDGGSIQGAPRTRKVWLLLAYLLLTRRPAGQDELIRLLWNREECSRPASALKNIVYRVRKLLCENLGEGEYLLCRDGSYGWNSEYPYLTDCEELERLAAEADNAPPEQRERLLREVDGLYRGDFLPQMEFSEWVLAQRRRYEELRAVSLLKLGDLLRQEGRTEELICLGERLTAEKPDREEFWQMLLGGYLDAGCHQKAMDCCDNAAHRFEGTAAAERIRRFYAESLPAQSSVDLDFSALRETLREGEEVGAFFCTFDLFQNICRLQARLLQRESRRLCLVLLSPECAEEQSGRIMEAVKETLIVGLRRGDVVSQYGMHQFVVLLVLREESDCEKVLNRLKHIFHTHYPDLPADWLTRFGRVEPAEEFH